MLTIPQRLEVFDRDARRGFWEHAVRPELREFVQAAIAFWQSVRHSIPSQAGDSKPRRPAAFFRSRPPDGALGVAHYWSISRRIVELVRTLVILAGVLGPANVVEAIRSPRPFGVDSKTKTDRDGSHQNDLDRVRRFYEAARAEYTALSAKGRT